MKLSKIACFLGTIGSIVVNPVLADNSKTKTETLTETANANWQNDVQKLWKRYGHPDFQVTFDRDSLDESLPWLTEFLNVSSPPEPSFEKVTDWLFTTWSKRTLQDYLKDHSIPFDASLKKDELISLLGENLEYIDKDFENFRGTIPDRTIFKSWSINDLKQWLENSSVKINETISTDRDTLLKLVSDNMYKVSVTQEAAKYKVLHFLDLANKKLFDSNNNITAAAFNDFSKDDLKRWLQFHYIKMNDTVSDNRDALLQKAQENLCLLKNDVDWYIKKSSDMASPFIGKNPEFVESLWGGMSDYVNTGKNHANKLLSEDFAKKILNSLNIEYSSNTSMKELIDLMKNKTIDMFDHRDFNYSGDLSLEKIKEWVSNTTSQVGDSELYGKMNHKMKGLNDHMDNLFKSWSVKDLMEYMKNMDIPFTESPDKETLIERAKNYTRKMLGYEPESEYQKLIRKAKEFSKNIINAVMPNN
ncbi:similar to Saccharomyces cerevisiae YML128C MSC1 Protein of unknown function [Maudiozyma barnettii]|uniref:Meiotic sister chromatid recombination protein 1 n=1 Tax=Maudiozyma barnettii TaxID=61262 RepID=A0A8H2VCZ7_9SACH|nr:Msc1p [Kazachstania barnettii]CAB4252978.1 similar to Saccharomyces cerevisiae YML128C MSC1 Protein of unknown function [Kazachstania barnettii]CAD1780776.1 similar to Saccharomyces cerevisiae YML128C MSC1 Protein of unknown function [Kazachstania barnettii]